MGRADPDRSERNDGFARVEPAQGTQVANLGRRQFRGGGEVEPSRRAFNVYQALIPHIAEQNRRLFLDPSGRGVPH